MTDKEAFFEFARGFLFCFGIVLVFISFATLIPESKPKEKFKVVDTYKGCDIVRYTDPSNDYRYFLDCTNTNELDNQSRS